jgi:uncharacterized protein
MDAIERPATLSEKSMKLTSSGKERDLSNPRLLVPPFEAHPWLKGGHSQTIVGRYLGGERKRLSAIAHEVELQDGDRLLILESVPPGWESPRPTAVLVHGLAGSADAPYVVRVGERLLRQGIRVVRINMRGAGAGFGLARGIYHAGRSDDLREVVNWLDERNPGAAIGLIGFSLGANLVLKLAGEASANPLRALDCVLAANPPVDLAACAQLMLKPENRLYDWNFVRWLRKTVVQLHNRFPELGRAPLEGVKTLYDFDDRYTAPRNGFGSADEYYRRCSLMNALARIQVPGLIVHAMDDPFVTHEPLARADKPASLTVELVRHGGHLGYLSRHPWQGDRRWLDARLAAWLNSHWACVTGL